MTQTLKIDQSLKAAGPVPKRYGNLVLLISLTLCIMVTISCSVTRGVDGGISPTPAVKVSPTVAPDQSTKNAPLLFLFASDLHLFPENITDIYDKRLKRTYTPGYQRFKKLLERCDNNVKRMYLLGDILEAPEFYKRPENKECNNRKNSPENHIDQLFQSELKQFLDTLSPYKECTKKLRMILGNNDTRNNKQTRLFIEKMAAYNYPAPLLKPTCYTDLKDLVWIDKINENIAALGLYVPDKIANITDDEFFNLDMLHLVIKSKMREILKSQKDVKLIFLMVHQGFATDEIWSLQFEIREFMRKRRKDADEKLDKWEKCVKKTREVLAEFDNDTGAESMPDIVVISGHVHKGFVIHSPHELTHILCPSLVEGDRDVKGMVEGSYLRLIYHPETHSIDIIYDNVNKNKNQNPSKVTAYL
ncbi:MAG: hypothetical protein GY757_24230 [bacterium]|nr:hypothetical protein [bacterium]